MTNGNGPNWGAIFGGISLLCTVITAAAVFGKLQGQVAQNTKEIAEIRADGRNNATTLTQINERTARMETKLEILLPTSAIKTMEAHR